ncbi:MAG: WG repeat-containing protein [Candidatus Gastranaerophilales bacterium]|nr:WG repeat-containing protein [Candidatus Gastranaerophilales bacterium]
MNKTFEKITIIAIHLFCLVAITELTVNYFSFHFLFPIKNDTSYGYIERKTNRTIIPLNKYKSRFKAQLALPIELVRANIASNKELKKAYNESTKKYGYIDSENKQIIDYKFDTANEFENDYAIVAINKKYGTIDKQGNWIIEPKYTYLCPFMKYYTKACLDNNHCGVIDRYGNEVTLMSYKTDKLQCKGNDCGVKFCAIGKDNKTSCNYFL